MALHRHRCVIVGWVRAREEGGGQGQGRYWLRERSSSASLACVEEPGEGKVSVIVVCENVVLLVEGGVRQGGSGSVGIGVLLASPLSS